ncbi:hypothetical protein [Sphingopyxis kveilinensis]|uniref:hypothetical protein n=1 Tax=Sphingopyxis kveilinensis TaxID=3114367 RepID=UPI0030D4EEC4
MALKQPRLTILAAALLSLTPGFASAAAKETDASGTPVQVQQVYDCRAIGDAAARLACFDRQVDALEQAQTANDVTFFDRAAAQRARRGLFGFTLRDLPFFGGGDDDKEKMARLETKIKWARREGYNKMRFEIEDGAIWMQTDQTDVPRDPKPGEQVVIYPGAMGSYFAEIGHMKRIRVRRER